jgi:ribose/xylose/arabinose/galactoside ABC-type transport system permease subunit
MIMALRLTFVTIAGGIDLSVAYVMGLSSVASAMVMARPGTSCRWRWWCWPAWPAG